MRNAVVDKQRKTSTIAVDTTVEANSTTRSYTHRSPTLSAMFYHHTTTPNFPVNSGLYTVSPGPINKTNISLRKEL